MRRLLLVRHGETQWNRELRYQGHTDVPLSERGVEQIRRLARRLDGLPIDLAYSSDLRRALDSAQALLAGRETVLQPTPLLREMSFGQWEGHSYAELSRAFPEEIARKEVDPISFAPPKGESLRDLQRRCHQFLGDIGVADHSPAAEREEETILVVAHGGPIRILLCSLLGMPVAGYWRFALQAASLSVVEHYSEGAMVTLLNDTSHLNGMPDHLPWPSPGKTSPHSQRASVSGRR